jgi:condensin complex subunit 3
MVANACQIDTIGEMLLLNDLPDKHLECIVETMRKISLNEKDFTRIIIEIISDLRESTEADQEDATNQFDVSTRPYF